MTDLQKLANAAPWDGDDAACAMCADAVATWCVGVEGWCADCLARAAINALTPASDGRAEGLREAAEECQRLSESYTRSLSHYDEDHPERAKIKWGAAAVTVAAENILARIKEGE